MPGIGSSTNLKGRRGKLTQPHLDSRQTVVKLFKKIKIHLTLNFYASSLAYQMDPNSS
jgi:hypothetical protein